ncbi:Na(+)-translocating NADH-quinone reductase subunit F [Olleya sp. YS]|uniref:Na(+)-translocating NADH-quinone reductase subunit F n=1 Tax=Olleya sp. YS TaxID=3028318 RepID=UPI0024345169|nr:Na(+)-translocating NADH-quinone reductase subunit F [Olleya sp. YS]WGD35361.1 Na(+)-translocating NADH-quinone reductase subunit F [Olleya sp. YS]
MELPSRLEIALSKLYNAFHDGTLHPEYCTKCAVGNICNNLEFWTHLTDAHGSVKLNYVGLVNQNFGKRFFGYTPLELLHIEAAFLKGCGYELPLNGTNKKPENPKDNSVLFNGLTEAVKVLCKLDNIPDVMNYSKLFETENHKPRYQLSDILV